MIERQQAQPGISIIVLSIFSNFSSSVRWWDFSGTNVNMLLILGNKFWKILRKKNFEFQLFKESILRNKYSNIWNSAIENLNFILWGGKKNSENFYDFKLHKTDEFQVN